MAETDVTSPETDNEMVRVELELTHPNCWSERATLACDAGLLGHGVFTGNDDVAKGRFTVYSDTVDGVECLIRHTREMDLTGPVMEVEKSWEVTAPATASPGNATKEIFVTFNPKNALDQYFIRRGFVYDGPVQIADGVEHWSLMGHHDRQSVQTHIEEIAELGHADIEIKSITTRHGSNGGSADGLQQLSVRQREIFEYARNKGYYQWPRGVTARELAADLDISKTTFLEHLRKAEAKLLKTL